MNSLYVIGAGGHGKVVYELALACGYSVEGFIDRDITKRPFGKPTITLETLYANSPNTMLALGIGDNQLREKLFNEAKALGFRFPPLIHPLACYSPSACIDEGSVVMAGAIINTEASIKKGVIVNSGAVIEHDVILDNFVHISPNAALAGAVHIHAHAHIGISACIIQGLNVGARSTLGAGATLIHSLPADIVAVGTPAKVIKHV